MEAPLDELLNDLRSSAISRDWDKILDAIQRVLNHSGFESALQIGVTIIQSQLNYFETVHTHKVWPRKCLERVLGVAHGMATIDEQLELPLEDENLLEPGLNSFVKAVEDLWEAASTRKSSYSEAVTDAIAGIIISQATQLWSESHPQRWEEWAKSSDEDKIKKPLDFWHDAQTQQAIQDSCMKIADLIEHHIG